MKKYADSPIPSIVDLGNESYEFCYNQGIETSQGGMDNKIHTSHTADYVVVQGEPNKTNIVAELKKQMTETKANELVKNLTI